MNMFDDTIRPSANDALCEEGATETEVPATQVQGPSSRTRYRDAAMSWLALGALLAAWHMEARLERPDPPGSRMAAVRNTSQKYSNQLWLNRAAASRSWIARAPAGVTVKTAGAARAETVDADQPEWSSLASVRTARRWLDSH